MKPDSCIVLTHEVDGQPLLPHHHWLLQHNPDVDVHVCVGADHPDGKEASWMNGDIPLRDYWRANRDRIKGEVIAVVEWDTLVLDALPELPSVFDLAGMIIVPGRRGPFTEATSNLPKEIKDRLDVNKGQGAYRPHCLQILSFGMLVMRRSVLDATINPFWDPLYAVSVRNEARLATLAFVEGFRLGRIKLPYVTCHDAPPVCGPGIYHGVDSPHSGL